MKREENGVRTERGVTKWWAAVVIIVAYGGITGSVAAAHDPSQHKATATHGVVARASKDAVTVMTEGKEITYTLLRETKILRDGKSVKAGELPQGTHVEVYSTKLPGGKVAASEINLTDAPRDGAGEGRATGHEHGGADGHVR